MALASELGVLSLTPTWAPSSPPGALAPTLDVPLYPAWHLCLFSRPVECVFLKNQDPTRSTIHEQSQTVGFFLQTEQLPDHPDVSGDRL